MPIYNIWIVRALAVRLRQPGMGPQRRFMAAASFVTVVLLVGAVIYLFRQPTEGAMERAALKVFAAAGVYVVGLIAAAVYVRRRTGANWPLEDALRMGGVKGRRQDSKGR